MNSRYHVFFTGTEELKIHNDSKVDKLTGCLQKLPDDHFSNYFSNNKRN